MSAFNLLCILPAERYDLAMAVTMAGGTPVIDVSCSERHPVPSGAWVRSRSKRAIPGKGPVILCGGRHRTPIRNRETWLEVTEAKAVPKGFAGIILRGSEAGGMSGQSEGLEMLKSLPPGQNVILDAGTLPHEIDSAKGLGARGVVLSDVLMGLPELQLPNRWFELLSHPEFLQQANNSRVMAKPLSPALNRLIGGESWFKVCSNWYALNNPKDALWPAGLAASHAKALAQQYTSLKQLLDAYQGRFETVETVEPVQAKATQSAQKTTVERTEASGIVVQEKISNEPIAIVGMGCRFPKASSPSLESLEQPQIRPTSSSRSKKRWDSALFWDPDPKTPDKTYAKIGGFLTDFAFNSKAFRIPPRVAGHIDPVQQIALESVAEALEDGNYTKARDFDRDRVAVILGNSMGGELTDDYTMRSRLPEALEHLHEIPAFQKLSAQEQSEVKSQLLEKYRAELPSINEDAMPGELANVIAGRIANAFNFNGPNYTVDAACASSMAAVQAAVKGLRDKEFDMAVTGGADRSMGIATYVKFSKIGALSASISAPSDERPLALSWEKAADHAPQTVERRPTRRRQDVTPSSVGGCILRW